jgi:PAS domain S-box-containing protein
VTAPRPRILVVVGRASARQRLMDALQRAGFEVDGAGDGREAEALTPDRRPDLVLLDERLPDGPGIDLSRRLRAHASFERAHIVLIERGEAGAGRVEADAACLDGPPPGPDSRLVRPFPERGLIAHVEHMLTLQGRMAALEVGQEELLQARRAVLSMMQDTESARRRSEDTYRRLEASTQSLNLLSQAIETSPVIVVITDRDCRIEYINAHASRVTGYSADELLGQHTRIFKSGRHPPEFYAELWATLTAGRQWQGEFCNRTKNGELEWEMASIAPVCGPSGDVSHYIAVKEVVTERRRVMEALEVARLEAVSANRAKSEFLASMSHELRTPLTALIGFSEVLRDRTFGPLNDKQIRYVNHMLMAANQLLSLINDVLDLAKIEAGRVDLELSRVALPVLIQQAIELVREKANERSIRLDAEVQVPSVDADERMLRQILANLLANAVKFTPKGGTVSVSAHQTGNVLQVGVRDTGIGISPDDQLLLFHDFIQLHPGYARQHEGTGLGLALCRRFVNLHGGRIWVDSHGGGQGSTFWFTIRLQREAAARGVTSG